jgi:hypothetical protein
VLSLVVFSACSPQDSPVQETVTVQVLEIDQNQDSELDQESEQDQNSDQQSSAAGGNECLVGSWQTVPGSISDYLYEAMNSTGSDTITFGVEEIQGYLSLEFTSDGEMLGKADEYRVLVTIEELGSEFEIIMTLSGSAEYQANATELMITDPNYDAEASGDGFIAGIQTGEQVVRIDLAPGSFSLQGGPLVMSNEVESTSGTSYSCAGDSLILDIPDFSSVAWYWVQ